MINNFNNNFVREVLEHQMTSKEILNWYRNLYHAENSNTEHGIVAMAINDMFLASQREIEDAAVDEFVDYLKSTQVSKMDDMVSDYIAIEDIELAAKEFTEAEE